MASQIREAEITIGWAPCPPEKLPALRYGINTLFEWLESLPDVPASDKPERVKVTVINERQDSTLEKHPGYA